MKNKTVKTSTTKYARKNLRLSKLAQKGMLHHFLPIIFIVVFAIAGVGYLVYTHAVTQTPEIESGIVNKGEGSWCVTDENGKWGANNPIYSKACNGTASQFFAYNTSSDLVEDTQISGNRCLGLYKNGTAAGTKVVMNKCSTASSQKWTYDKTTGLFESVLASKGKRPNECLSIAGGVTGKQLKINNCDASYDSQVWYVTKYTPPTTPPPPPPSSSMNIITSLYAYPTLPVWSQVESAAPTVKYAIINICAPDGTGSGCPGGKPADEPAPAWDNTIQALVKAGITPLYYISTNYGTEPIATVESELSNAKTWYGVASPMFDTTSTADPAYYSALYNYSVGLGANAVVFNPGTIPPQSYMFGGTTGSKEIIQVFENTASAFEGTSFPSWMSSYPASEFAATISAGTSSTVGTDVNDATNDHIGNFYEDDESEPPNYATLPAFWLTEVNDVKSSS